MKKLLLGLLVLLSATTQAQDTTKVKGLQLPAKLIYFLQPAIRKPDNDSLFQVAIDLRKQLKNDPQGTTLVTIDSIPTVELANLYNYVLNGPAGFGLAKPMKDQLAPIRLINSFLDTLCTEYENFIAIQLNSTIKQGKKMATNRQQ